jgi:hypothetical protein
MENFKSYWIVFVVFPYFIFCFLILRRDKNDDMKRYINDEFKDTGVEITKIEHVKSNLFNMPFNWEDEDIIVHPASGGKGAVRFNVYSVYKNIFIKLPSGEKKTALVSVDFRGFHNRQLKRVRFKPNLSSLISSVS